MHTHIRQRKNVRDPKKTTSQSKYKQLTRASLNLIDNVLRNNTAYFGWTVSKLTATLSPPDILPGRSAALQEGRTGKGILRKKKKEKERKTEHSGSEPGIMETFNKEVWKSGGPQISSGLPFLRRSILEV